MPTRESAIGHDKKSLLTLVRVFAGHRCPVHFWRGEWFAWTGTHYEQVGQQGIEQQAMAFLEENSPTPVNGSMIRRFLDLLRIVRYADHPTAPCWLTTGRLPSPTELFAVNNGLLRISGGPELLPHDPAFFNLSAVSYDYCPTADCPRWRQFLNELWRDSVPVQLLQNGLAIVCCRIRLNRRYSRSTDLREVGKAPQPESCGHCSEVATSRVRPFGR